MGQEGIKYFQSAELGFKNKFAHTHPLETVFIFICFIAGRGRVKGWKSLRILMQFYSWEVWPFPHMHISVRVEGLLERAEGLRERSLHFEGTPTLSLFFIIQRLSPPHSLSLPDESLHKLPVFQIFSLTSPSKLEIRSQLKFPIISCTSWGHMFG